ncbi:MAG: EMC3/TMCO1 family protein [Candidatus Micrarchaeia archaeon]
MELLGASLIIGAALYVALSIFLQRKLVNTKRLREIQGIVKAKTKELTELSKSNADQSTLISKQKELTPLLSESMMMQFKPMLVILPLFIVIYYVFLPMAFAHVSAKFYLLSFGMNYQLYFIVFSFIFGIIGSIIVAVYDRKKLKEETMKQQEPQQS